MTPSHDLIVIGSGPAGSAAATTAARAGLRVVLIDKATFPRDKLCGGGFTGRSRRHMQEIFGCDVDSERFLACTQVRLTAKGQVLAEVNDAPPVWMTMRRDLDALLLDRAIAEGCDTRLGKRIAELCVETGRVKLASGEVLSAPVVVGADGANSMVARSLFGRAYNPRRIGFGLEVEAPLDGSSALEIDFAAAAWGYGWVFPKQGSRTIGVGGVHVSNPVMRDKLDAFLKRHGADPGALDCKGAFLPFGDVRAVPGKGRVLLAGDAAGLVDPITGEGIAWAMRSGQLAAQAAIAAHATGAEQVLADYSRRLRPVQRELARARMLRRFFYHPVLQPAFLRLLAREPRVQRRYLSLLSGDLDYSDLGWRALPGLGLRLFSRAANRPLA